MTSVNLQDVFEEPHKNDLGKFRDVFLHLQQILTDYLKKHPHITTAGMSKRCAISEPTLRRIRSGQVKTLPSVTTIVELLVYISKEDSAQKLLATYPGPLAEYLKDKLVQFEFRNEIKYSEPLSRALKDPIKYLIYKLAAMPKGVAPQRITELFGNYGETQVKNLLEEDLLFIEKGRLHGKIKNYALSNDDFIEHFKSTANFIKPHKHAMAAKQYSPIFSNYSNGLSKKAYSEILKIQRAANKKIIAILNDKNAEGAIPTFILNAVDTLDKYCADEYPTSGDREKDHENQ